MTQHELTAYKFMKRNYNEYVGGNENAMMDNPPDSEEFIEAQQNLNDTDDIINTVYNWTMHDLERHKFTKHAKFAGTDFIKNEIRKLLIRDGFLKA